MKKTRIRHYPSQHNKIIKLHEHLLFTAITKLNLAVHEQIYFKLQYVIFPEFHHRNYSSKIFSRLNEAAAFWKEF